MKSHPYLRRLYALLKKRRVQEYEEYVRHTTYGTRSSLKTGLDVKKFTVSATSGAVRGSRAEHGLGKDKGNVHSKKKTIHGQSVLAHKSFVWS